MTLLSALWAFVQAAFALVLGWASDFLTWLRKPGSVLKVVCAALAVAFALAAMSSYRQGQRVVVVTKQVDQCLAEKVAAAEAAQLKAAEWAANVADKDAALATIADKLKAEAENLKRLQERNEALRAQTEATKAKADASAKAFKQQYDQRPPECSAALQAMAAACPTLGGY
jgi:septal ring factor EnvC (AmiA/AmiB activator)